MMAAIEPAIWLAPPAKAVGVGDATVGFVPLPAMLLTRSDGQAVPLDIGGVVRVTITSGAGPVGQAVPQAARTVDCEIVRPSHLFQITRTALTCALAPATAARKMAASAKRMMTFGWDVFGTLEVMLRIF